MKLNEIFEPNDLPENDTDQYVNFIKKHCSQIVKVYRETGKVLYRGFRENVNKSIFMAETPVNRLPRDTDALSSHVFDKVLQTLKIKSLRSNSIFTTAKIRQAQGYTTPSDTNCYGDLNSIFTIFPINGFEYCWNERENDMCITDYYMAKVCTGRFLYSTPTAVDSVILKDIINDYPNIKQQVIANIVERWMPLSTNLKEAIIQEHEVWIHGKYIAIRNSKENLISQILE